MNTNFHYWNIYDTELTPIEFKKQIQNINNQSIAAFNLSEIISVLSENTFRNKKLLIMDLLTAIICFQRMEKRNPIL